MVGDRAGLLAAVLLLAVSAGAGTGGGLPVGGSVEEPVGHTVGTLARLDAGGGVATPAIVSLQSTPEADNTITRISLARNGTATWELRIRTRLSTDGQVQEYRAFQERFRENESRFVDGFQESITGIVANARGVTGREMSATEFRATTSIQSVPRRWGVVVYEFRWIGFAEADGDRLRVGDVFEGGLFIAEGDALEVVGPAGYGVESAEPAPDESGERTVTWQGREDFADRRPQVVFAPAGAAEPGTGTASLPWTGIAGAAALVLLVAGATVAYRRRRGRLGGDDGGSASAGGSRTLADEDYVRRLLGDHGGRIRQKEVADALGWSRSKTSRVLSRMEEAGAIEKLRLGRENVIALPEDEE